MSNFTINVPLAEKETTLSLLHHIGADFTMIEAKSSVNVHIIAKGGTIEEQLYWAYALGNLIGDQLARVHVFKHSHH